MRVKCVRLLPTPEQTEQLTGQYYQGREVFFVEVGRDYTVLGLSIYRGIPWVQLELQEGRLTFAPLCLFDVTDPRVSKYWEVKAWEDGQLTFWPRSFYQEFYADDLLEGVPGVVADFEAVKTAVYTEFES